MYQLTTGKIKKPYFMLVFGSDGVGKTTFAASAPDPAIIDIEKGSGEIENIFRFPHPKNFSDVINMAKWFKTEVKKTLIIDSVDRLEGLCWDEVIKDQNSAKVTSMEDLPFGKGYAFALEKWKQLIAVLKDLRETKNVILVGHSIVKTFNDPNQVTGYDRHELKLNAKAAALIKEEVDAVLFATEEVFVKQEKNAPKGKAIGSGKRILFTERRPGHEGKNRFGLPYEIELSWPVFVEAAEKGDSESAEVLLSQISGLVSDIKDQTIAEKVRKTVETDKSNPAKLRQILNRINIIVGEQA